MIVKLAEIEVGNKAEIEVEFIVDHTFFLRNSPSDFEVHFSKTEPLDLQ